MHSVQVVFGNGVVTTSHLIIQSYAPAQNDTWTYIWPTYGLLDNVQQRSVTLHCTHAYQTCRLISILPLPAGHCAVPPVAAAALAA